MDIIINQLQDSYNKYNKAKSDFTSKLKELKEIGEDQDYISNSVKYTNWQIIAETLRQFGLNYTEEDINKIVNGDKDFLLKVLTEIYDKFTQNLKNAQNRDNTKKKTKKSDTNFDKVSKKSNLNIDGLNDTKSMNEINSTTFKKIAQDHTLNINNLDENKPYEDCLSALEFFIISFFLKTL